MNTLNSVSKKSGAEHFLFDSSNASAQPGLNYV
jgi:hypothetical protein